MMELATSYHRGKREGRWAVCGYIECVGFGLFLLISDLDILLTYTYNLVSCVGLYLLVSKHSILSPLERELG